MPGQAINATLDLEGLEVIGVVASGDLIELVVESRFDAGACRSCGGLAPEPKERPEILFLSFPVGRQFRPPGVLEY
jgi:hypothetical protein